MASRGGPRALGSDGNDFQHRERVLGHYQASAVNKSRLRYAIYLHLLLILLMLLRLSVSFFVMLNIRPPPFLQQLRLPRAWLWEYIWLMSSTASFFGLIAIRKNRQFLILQYMIGTAIFGLGPVGYAIISFLNDLLAYWETRETNQLFLGFPIVVLWNMFLVITLQLHFFGMYFAWNLYKAWKPREKKKAT